MLLCKVRQAGNVTILELNGRLRLGESLTFGSGNAVSLGDIIRDLFKKGDTRILLNLRDLTFIDSTGIGELVAAYSSLQRQGGQLKVASASGAVRNTFRDTQLDTILDMRDEEAEAIRSFQPLTAAVPERYKRIGTEVAEVLPHGWDDHARWSFSINSDGSPPGFASTSAEEPVGEPRTPYVITLYPVQMDRLSDLACRWIIAHEFGHIASKLRTGSTLLLGHAYSPMHAADQIALAWGFDRELRAFLAETSAQALAGT